MSAPHGWALTIASVQRGLLQWNADTVDALYACADCGMCRTHCVTDQPLPEAIVAADIPGVLRAANRSAVKYHFIEDEHPESEKQIPRSLEYLASLRL